MSAKNIDNPAYSSYYQRVDSNLLVRVFQKFKYIFILPFRRYLSPDSAIMDVGCARGNFFRILISHGYTNLHGLDLINKLYPDLSRRVAFYSGSILKRSDLPSEKFDGVFLQSVLHHLPVDHLNFAARNLTSVIKPGGVLFIYDTNRTSLCGRLFYDWFERFIPYMFRDALNERSEQIAFSNEWPHFIDTLEKNGFLRLKHSNSWFYTAYIGRRAEVDF